VDATKVAAIIEDLEASVTYNVHLRLRNNFQGSDDQYLGTRTKTISFTTEDYTPDGEPTGVVVDKEQSTHGGATIEWEPPTPFKQNGRITEYRLTWWYDASVSGNDYDLQKCNKEGECQEIIEADGSIKSDDGKTKLHFFELGGAESEQQRLAPYTDYMVGIEARTQYDNNGVDYDDTWGPPSQPKQFRTRSGVPRVPTFEARNKNNTKYVGTKQSDDPDYYFEGVDSDNGNTSARVRLDWDTFDETTGPIVQMRVIVEIKYHNDTCDEPQEADDYTRKEAGSKCGGPCKQCVKKPEAKFDEEALNGHINFMVPLSQCGFTKDEADRKGDTHCIIEGLAPDTRYGFRIVVFTEDELWSMSSEILPLRTEKLPKTAAVAGSPVAAAAGAGAVVILGLVALVFARKAKSEKEQKKKEDILMKDMRTRRSAKAAEEGNGGGGGGGRGGGVSSDPDEIDLDDFSAYDALEETAIAGTGVQGSDMGLNIPPVPRLGPVQRCVIPTEELGNVITQMSANSDFAFSEEYECLETGNDFSRMASQLMENKVKNRYANILPYDYTRVRLEINPSDRFSDYINANFLEGYAGKPKHYIAAQGPTPHTLPDFWRLLWEHSVQIIAMVTNCEEKGRIKCQRYWPTAEEDELDLQNGLYVTLVDEQNFPDYVIRTLRCRSSSGASRNIVQFHYTTWPDHGVPVGTAGLAGMIRKIRIARAPGGRADSTKGPMLVHCSAGVGRTGTLIAIDVNLDSIIDRNSVDPLGTLNTMRRQRSTMVQTEQQYIFIYKSLFDAQNNVTEFDATALREHVLALRKPNNQGVINLESEFKKLNGAATAPNARTDSAQMSVNREKNRFQNVLPFESTRVKLIPVPGVTGSDYINANFLDGFKNRGAYIATQGPLERTMGDFWRMVWEHEIDIVTMLTALSEGGRAKSEHYWPDAEEPPLNCGDYQIAHVSTQRTTYGFNRVVRLTNLLSEQSRDVKHFQYTVWPASTPSYNDAEVFFELREHILAYQTSRLVMPMNSIYGNAEAINEQSRLAQLKPVVVHCSAGVGRTGAFVGLMASMERLRDEEMADPFTVVKHMRTQRMSIVQTPEQYEYIYQMLVYTLDKEGGGPPPPIPAKSVGNESSTAEAAPLPPARRHTATMDLGADDGEIDLDSIGGAPPALPAKTLSLDEGADLRAVAETSFSSDTAPAPDAAAMSMLLGSMQSFDDAGTGGGDASTDGYEITYDGDEYGLSI